MKRRLISFLIISTVGILASCQAMELDDKRSDSEQSDDYFETTIEERDHLEEEDPSDRSDATESRNDEQAYMNSELMDRYFTEVVIEVEYEDSKEYEAEIKQDNGEIKAEIDDELNGEKIKGVEAFDYIVERMEQVEVTPISDMGEVTEEILSLFDLPKTYKELEIEVKFHNGSKIEIEDKMK